MDEPFLEHLKSLKILSELCEVYYQNTGMMIAFRDPGRHGKILDYPPEQKSEYCKLIQSSEEGLRRCLRCDREGLATARRKGSFHIYQCHAGLVDVACALEYKGTEIGSIYTGQVLLEPPSPRSFRRIQRRVRGLPVALPQLEEAYLRVKIVEKSRLHFYAKLLHLFGNYIIKAENELYLQQMVALKDRELHSRELEKIKLEKTLKDLTISTLRGAPAAGEQGLEKGNRLVAQAQSFIRENYAKDIRLEDVARAVYLSPNYFSSLFRRISGCTFRSYLVRQRIGAARDLLAGSDLPIKAVVARAGFKDYNYFNRTFTLLEKTTPARYRRRFAAVRAS